jgi:nitroreductase
MDELEKNVFDAIYGRRSIRRYKDKEVEKEKIIKLLKAGMAAPSACNLQPWEFIVVTDKEMLRQLKENIGEGNYNAPMAVVVCANTVNIPWGGDSWMVDCSAAVENMMLAATAMGLGSVWIGSQDEDGVRKLLDIPDRISVMNVVYFGYPDQEIKHGTRYNEEAVFWQKYDPDRKRSLRTIDMKYDLTVIDEE